MKWLTVKQVADTFQLEPATIRRWIKNKRINSVKISGNLIRISDQEVKAFYERNSNKGQPKTSV